MNARKHQSRKGFTLIELLVVVSVIAVLVSMLLPAVQQAREAVRRTQCINNLKQIGLAFNTYHETFSAFPHTDNGGSISRASALTSILPFLEQNAAYNLYNFSLGNSDTTNQVSVSQNIPTYMCPTAVIYRQVPIAGCDANNRAAGTYAVCTGSTDPYGTVIGSPPCNGAIIEHGSGRTRVKDFTDGLSLTLLGGESAWNFKDYTFTSGTCPGQIRWGFSYWSSPYPLATAFTTQGPLQSQVDERRQHAALELPQRSSDAREHGVCRRLRQIDQREHRPRLARRTRHPRRRGARRLLI